MQTIIITALVTAILCTISFVSWGQTFSEWFRQKKTRMKYLYKQIAALKVMKQAIEEGNEDAELEIDSEEVNMELEYKLAEEYLTSLGKVKPVFLTGGDIQGSIGLARATIKMAKEELAEWSKNKWLSQVDKRMLTSQFGLIISDMEQSMSNLRLLITEGKVQMDDGARWQMIHGIDDHIEIVNRYFHDKILETEALIDAQQEEEASEEFLKRHLQ